MTVGEVLRDSTIVETSIILQGRFPSLPHCFTFFSPIWSKVPIPEIRSTERVSLIYMGIEPERFQIWMLVL